MTDKKERKSVLMVAEIFTSNIKKNSNKPLTNINIV